MGYGTSDARGYVNARNAREERERRSVREPELPDIPRVSARERREALAVAAAVLRPGTFDREDWIPPEPERDRFGRPVGRGFGGVFDAEYDRPEDL